MGVCRYTLGMSVNYIVGIDEVGRGPLCGPVAVGLVVMKVSDYDTLRQTAIFPVGKDSKKLSAKKREFFLTKIKELQMGGVLNYGVFFEDNEVIDKQGIAVAIKMAIKKGLANLGSDPATTRVLLDGGLKAPSEFTQQESIIRGDEQELIIGLASIAAKVSRDQLMVSLAKEIPHYDLASNMGYGTARHCQDLKKYGPCSLHRKTFIRRFTVA